MNFDFLKTPTNIACLVIALVYILPFTPYLSFSSGSNKLSISGGQILIGSVSAEGDIKEVKDDVEDVLYDGKSTKGISREIPDLDTKPMLGILDKMSVLVFIAALVILFSSYKASIGERSPISAEGMRWIKIALVSTGTLLMFRYMMMPLMIFPINAVWSVGLGAFLTMMSIVVIYFDNKLK